MKDTDADRDRPPHEPEPGEWWVDLRCQELFQIRCIERWGEAVDEAFGEMVVWVYEDGILYDEPLRTLREDEHFVRVNRPDSVPDLTHPELDGDGAPRGYETSEE